MSYIIEFNEWRLLQTLSLYLDLRKSRFEPGALDSTPEPYHPSSIAAELFEVEVRRLFLPREYSRALSSTEFNECQEKLQGVCQLLDRIVHPWVSRAVTTDNNVSYPRLRALAQLLEHSDETFDLTTGSHSPLFNPPDNQAKLETSLALVTDYNDFLARLFVSPARETTVRSVSRKERKTWKDAKLRRQAASALGAVFDHLRCGTGHEVMLKISDDVDGAAVPSLDLILSSCPDPAQCSDAQCSETQWLDVRCGSIDSSWNASVAAIQNICFDLKQHAGQGKALILLIEQYGLFGAWTSLQSSQPFSTPPKESLDKLISNGAFKPLDLLTLTRGSPSIRYSPQEKRALAVRLGYCLMDFFDADLSSKRIYFLGSNARTSSSRNETLYLSFASGLPATAESHIFRVGHPTLLSFAKLLLEIDFGQSIDLCISPHYDKTNKGTWAELCDMVDQLEEERNDSYLQAVRGCLMVHTQISKALRLDGAEGKDAELTIRKELYKEVVQKLETALAESTPRARNKRQRSESPEPTPQKKSTYLTTHDEQQDSAYDTSDTCTSTESWRTSIRTKPVAWNRPAFKRPRMPGLQEARRAQFGLPSGVLMSGATGLFDDSTPDSYAEDLCRYADEFMDNHRLSYDQVINIETEAMPRIKVAVLDTGLDMTHPAINASQDRIKDFKSWLPPDRMNTGDLSGHGTHVTALLLDIAPDADIYVAQIADSRSTLPNQPANSRPIPPAEIAKAIMHAVTVWQVDIITMSFGFLDERQPGCSDLRDAILRAHAAKVLMFAAASNVGAHGAAPAFPARLSNVFCIFSGDGMGNCARSCPTARRHVHNFLTLGDAVESAWPKALSKYPWKKRKSGTSFATPIAAGIAAFLLLYACQTLPLEEAAKFKEYDKMRDWLVNVSYERNGYHVLSVGGFFGRPPEERRILLGNLLEGRPWRI